MSKIVLVNRKSRRVGGEIKTDNRRMVLSIKYLADEKMKEDILKVLRKYFILSDHNAHEKHKIETNWDRCRCGNLKRKISKSCRDCFETHQCRKLSYSKTLKKNEK